MWSEVDVHAQKSVESVGLHCYSFCAKVELDLCSGLRNYNNPSQQCRALADFDVHVLLITMC